MHVCVDKICNNHMFHAFRNSGCYIIYSLILKTKIMPQFNMLCSCSTCSCTCSRFITGRPINFWNTDRTVNADKQGKTMQLF